MQRSVVGKAAVVWVTAFAVLVSLAGGIRYFSARASEVRDLPVFERAARTEPLPPYVDGRVIVKYRSAAARGSASRVQVRQNLNATVRRSYVSMPDIESLTLGPGITVEAAVASLEADPNVEYAEPVYLYETHGLPDDPLFHNEWGLDNTGQRINDGDPGAPDADIDAPEAWDLATGSHDVVVAVVDEGMDFNHPDLAANAWVNPGEIPNNRIDDDNNGFVDDIHGWDFLHNDNSTFDGANDASNALDFHGTHTSGTIGAVGNNGVGLTGVCWNVQIMSLKFLNNTGSTDDAIACVDYAVMMKRRGVNIRAMNASWGGGEFSQGLFDAIIDASNADIVFCASAGNGGVDGIGDNNDLNPSYPASYNAPNVISVGALTRFDLRASYSNYGPSSVDLLAPGSLVASTGPNGSYYYSNGTSMAAPHVTGSVALLAAAAPSLTGAQIKDILLATTTHLVNAQVASGGRLNLAAALQLALETGGGDTGGGTGGGTGGDTGGDTGGGTGGDPQPFAPVLESVHFTPKKKTLYADGHEFSENTVIEVNGVAMPIIRYLPKNQLPDGTYVRLEGKAPGRLSQILPKGQTVQITMFDTVTQLRSAPVAFRR